MSTQGTTTKLPGTLEFTSHTSKRSNTSVTKQFANNNWIGQRAGQNEMLLLHEPIMERRQIKRYNRGGLYCNSLKCRSGIDNLTCRDWIRSEHHYIMGNFKTSSLLSYTKYSKDIKELVLETWWLEKWRSVSGGGCNQNWFWTDHKVMKGLIWFIQGAVSGGLLRRR